MNVRHEQLRGTPSSALLRVAALSGAGSFVLAVIGTAYTDKGARGLSPGLPTETLAAGFARYSQESMTGGALLGAAGLLSLVFLGPLWSRLERGSGWLAIIAVGGGVVGAALLLLTAALAIAEGTAGVYANGEAARTLLVLGWDSARVAAPPYLAMTLAAAVSGIRYHVFPTWLNAVSVIFTAVLGGALLPIGPAGLMGGLGGLWVVVVSLLLAFGRSLTTDVDMEN